MEIVLLLPSEHEKYRLCMSLFEGGWRKHVLQKCITKFKGKEKDSGQIFVFLQHLFSKYPLTQNKLIKINKELIKV